VSLKLWRPVDVCSLCKDVPTKNSNKKLIRKITSQEALKVRKKREEILPVMTVNDGIILPAGGEETAS
jgi:hypothetical protein